MQVRRGAGERTRVENEKKCGYMICCKTETKKNKPFLSPLADLENTEKNVPHGVLLQSQLFSHGDLTVQVRTTKVISPASWPHVCHIILIRNLHWCL